ncbi:MAG: type IV pili twitching motility protein PilT, partial [Verrucomicrobia bacterium]|nr:type IV pili twitching motility protein PilT [Verrucomicrobiota bacterium]
SALRASLREDPDVIMVGEMRDLETISLAITASETGHLVLGTLHTSTAARTLDRLLDVFPIDQQAQIRTMVSESLRGIVCQQLIPRQDGQGRVLALEVLVNNPAVGNLIREAKTFMLPGVMQTGKKLGMRLMDDSLKELVDQQLISPEEAHRRAENKKLFPVAAPGGTA